MPGKIGKSERKKIVVEEVIPNETPVVNEPEPQIDEEAATIEEPKAKEFEVEHVVHEHPQVLPVLEEQKELDTPLVTPIERPSNGPNPLLIIIPGLFLLGGLLGGIVFYQSKVSQTQTPATTPTPETIVEEATPTPSPSAEVDLTEFSIKVLNGSGTSGEAGKAQAILEKAGFEVASTGNASNYSYTKTVIQAKATVSKEFLTKLSETLSETYSVDSKTQTLSASTTEDVVVIVGSTKN